MSHGTRIVRTDCLEEGKWEVKSGDKNDAGGEATCDKYVVGMRQKCRMGCDKYVVGGATNLSHRSSTNEVEPLKKNPLKKGSAMRRESFRSGGVRRLSGAPPPHSQRYSNTNSAECR